MFGTFILVFNLDQRTTTNYFVKGQVLLNAMSGIVIFDHNNIMKQALFFLLSVSLIAGCNDKKPKADFNSIAERYVRLALTIGQYDPDFVDAYYGPDSLKPTIKKDSAFPRDSLLNAVAQLKNDVSAFSDSSSNADSIRQRALWMSGQLDAFAERIKIFSGTFSSFDEEARQLFGVKPPSYTEDHFKTLVSRLDSVLPGSGHIPARMQALANKFIIPPAMVDTVFKTAIQEAAKRTRAKYQLPSNESFVIEYVNDKPWSGYNWYKGNYYSIIQMNLDLPILIDRAIDLACHEGYPGHHVYNMLLEKNLYRDKGWVEISLYPLFSPQSLIAEGSANYGIAMSFPGNEAIEFSKNVLVPLAGLDTAGVESYFRALALKSQLNYARNEAARGLLDGKMDEKEAMRWLTQYALMSNETAVKSISFIKKNRTYVICYNYGQDLVKKYIESSGGDRWQSFEWLLSNPVSPNDLLNKKSNN